MRPLLGDRVADLVAGHTDAKRYLVTVDPSYADGLSLNSTITLRGQGGPMSEADLTAFVTRPHWRALVALRRADDAAKDPERAVRPPIAWAELLDGVAASFGAR